MLVYLVKLVKTILWVDMLKVVLLYIWNKQMLDFEQIIID
jgi:hypothetical protein